MTRLQDIIAEQRSHYEPMEKPLLQFFAEMHGISIRKFAELMDVSPAQAEKILKHKVLPSLEVALRISRYFDCSIEDLFGWRVEDAGNRCPRVVQLPKGEGFVRVNLKYVHRNALPLAHEAIAALKRKG